MLLHNQIARRRRQKWMNLKLPFQSGKLSHLKGKAPLLRISFPSNLSNQVQIPTRIRYRVYEWQNKLKLTLKKNWTIQNLSDKTYLGRLNLTKKWNLGFEGEEVLQINFRRQKWVRSRIWALDMSCGSFLMDLSRFSWGRGNFFFPLVPQQRSLPL